MAGFRRVGNGASRRRRARSIIDGAVPHRDAGGAIKRPAARRWSPIDVVGAQQPVEVTVGVKGGVRPRTTMFAPMYRAARCTCASQPCYDPATVMAESSTELIAAGAGPIATHARQPSRHLADLGWRSTREAWCWSARTASGIVAEAHPRPRTRAGRGHAHGLDLLRHGHAIPASDGRRARHRGRQAMAEAASGLPEVALPQGLADAATASRPIRTGPGQRPRATDHRLRPMTRVIDRPPTPLRPGVDVWKALLARRGDGPSSRCGGAGPR